jgi:hypothetical protein
VPKLVWRVKLVAELQPGVTTETEVARIERDEEAGLADLGLRLDEAKQLTAALQAEMVPAQVAVVGERVAGARPVGVRWPARAITPRRSAPCSATCRCGSDGCSSAPARARARRRASPPSTSARVRSPRNWPT